MRRPPAIAAVQQPRQTLPMISEAFRSAGLGRAEGTALRGCSFSGLSAFVAVRVPRRVRTLRGGRSGGPTRRGAVGRRIADGAPGLVSPGCRKSEAAAAGFVALGLRMSDAAAAGLKELGLRTSEAAALGLTATPCERAGADALRAATRLTTAKIQCMDLRPSPLRQRGR